MLGYNHFISMLGYEQSMHFRLPPSGSPSPFLRCSLQGVRYVVASLVSPSCSISAWSASSTDDAYVHRVLCPSVSVMLSAKALVRACCLQIHTPDSSRYWLADTYDERHEADLEPQNIDKEFLRLWFRERCDPYADKVLPEAPRELVEELSRRYVYLFERITGQKFQPPSLDAAVADRMLYNMQKYL
eukprot:GHUV01038255.1.p1 GENE.GHUV01038255.1~~GHUV01038255.1.p1  ORF type:complete len:187 (+),score=13.24 GHUV01038255.1:901-1461(+)